MMQLLLSPIGRKKTVTGITKSMILIYCRNFVIQFTIDSIEFHIQSSDRSIGSTNRMQSRFGAQKRQRRLVFPELSTVRRQ